MHPQVDPLLPDEDQEDPYQEDAAEDRENPENDGRKHRRRKQAAAKEPYARTIPAGPKTT